MKTKFLLSLPFLFQLTAFSQPTIQWQKCLGGSQQEVASSIQQTTDGGYIVAGYAASTDGNVTGNHGGNDYWIVKLDGSGAIQWQKSLGGSGDDEAQSVQQTTDGGYIVAGFSASTDGDVSGNHGSYDYWVVKLDGSGTIQWQKSLGGTLDDRAYSIEQTTDSGYIVAGYSNSSDGDASSNHGGADYWVVKLNSGGTIQWQKSLGGSGADDASSIQQTTDGGYIVIGTTASNDSDVIGFYGVDDYWIVKLNSTGTIQWQKCLGGFSADFASAIQQTTDGGYIVAGYTSSNNGQVNGNHGQIDYWVVKLDGNGALQWQKCLGGSQSDYGRSVQQTSDGGYIVAGETNSNDSNVSGNHSSFSDYWIVKLNGSGAIQWQKCLGGSFFDAAYSIRQTTDGGYIVAGGSASNDGDVSGNNSFTNVNDYWVVKLSPFVGIDDITANENSMVIYPNPLTSSSILQLNTQVNNAEVVIYDMIGKVMMRKKLTGDRMEIEKGSLESGVYFVKVSTEEKQWVQKIVVE